MEKSKPTMRDILDIRDVETALADVHQQYPDWSTDDCLERAVAKRWITPAQRDKWLQRTI